MWCAFAMLAVLSLADDALTHARRSYESQRAGDPAAAEREIRKAIELEPRNPLFHSALSGLLVQVHRPEEAVAELEQALSCHPPEAMQAQFLARLEPLQLSVGAQLAAASRYSEALTLARDGAARFPRSSAVLQMLGFFETKARLNRDAAESYRRALTLEPASIDAALGLAIAEAGAGMTAEAVRDFNLAMKTHPNEGRFPQALANALLAAPDASATDKSRAEALFGRALQLDPSLQESHYRLGQLALQANDAPAALLHLNEALRLNPNDARVHFAFARLYRKQQRASEAQREMELFTRLQQAARTP